jgi:hypothetical protein
MSHASRNILANTRLLTHSFYPSKLLDVVLGLVTMKFRVTIFWNAPTDAEHQSMGTTGYGNYDATNTKVWTMHGRQRAYQRELSEILPGSKLVREFVAQHTTLSMHVSLVSRLCDDLHCK